jgi:hypothetical protein
MQVDAIVLGFTLVRKSSSILLLLTQTSAAAELANFHVEVAPTWSKDVTLQKLQLQDSGVVTPQPLTSAVLVIETLQPKCVAVN